MKETIFPPGTQFSIVWNDSIFTVFCINIFPHESAKFEATVALFKQWTSVVINENMPLKKPHQL